MEFLRFLDLKKQVWRRMLEMYQKTLSFTTVFSDLARWVREVDLDALHEFNQSNLRFLVKNTLLNNSHLERFTSFEACKKSFVIFFPWNVTNVFVFFFENLKMTFTVSV